MNKLTIKETEFSDLTNIMKLWNNGDVMKYVGFEDGLNITKEQIEKWHKNIKRALYTKHYSIYHEELGFCGETFYSIIKKHDLGMLDIKLFDFARKKGIAKFSLEYAIKEVFDNDLCSKVYVDPSVKNKDAWKLYEKIGFIQKERPTFLEPADVYLELTKKDFEKLVTTK